jgi:hypothetical protein
MNFEGLILRSSYFGVLPMERDRLCSIIFDVISLNEHQINELIVKPA